MPNPAISVLKESTNFFTPPSPLDADHGSGVLSKVIGTRLGFSKKAKVVIVGSVDAFPTAPQDEVVNRLGERRLVHLQDALDDIKRQGRGKRTVINMSFGIRPNQMPPAFFNKMREFFLGPVLCLAGA